MSVDQSTNKDANDHSDDQSFAHFEDMPNCAACGNAMAIAEALQEIEDQATTYGQEVYFGNCDDSIGITEGDVNSNYDADDDSESMPPLAD